MDAVEHRRIEVSTMTKEQREQLIKEQKEQGYEFVATSDFAGYWYHFEHSSENNK